MTWTNVKDKLPQQETNVLVINLKGWMGTTRAIYYPHYNTFVHYDPQMHEKLTLDVTHWMQIPELPEKK